MELTNALKKIKNKIDQNVALSDVEKQILEEEKVEEEKPLDTVNMLAHRVGERYKIEETDDVVWVNYYVQRVPPSITYGLSDDQDSPV